MSQSPATNFLTALWERAPGDLFFLIWTMPDKRSRWFRTTTSGIASAAETVHRLESNDVYMGVAASSQSYGTRQRVSAIETAALVGLWADVDHASAGAHKKPNLPPDVAAARELLDESMPPPSHLIHSGNGLQAWWLFDKPWVFGSQQEQAAAADLAKRWVDRLRAGAEKHGWTVDATHDLARVMRVPGTLNHKTDPPRPCVSLETEGPRYEMSELRSLVKAPPIGEVDLLLTATSDSVGFELRPAASPPFRKWEALRRADRVIEQTWTRQRRDLGDQSASGYDMALANFAAMAGWEDQEIVDLLICHRSEHGDDLKLDRTDYYARTLRKARDAAARSVASDQIDATLHELDVAAPEEQAEKRTNLLDWLSPILKTGVSRIERYSTEPATYRMLTEAGWVDLGTTADLLQQTKVRAALMETTRTRFDRMKAGEWDRVAEAIVRAAYDVDVGPEPTTSGSTRDWLTEYLQQHHPADGPEESVLIARVPYRSGGGLFIFLNHFRAWLERSDGEKLTRNATAMRLRLIGAEPHRVNCTIDGTTTSRSVWKLPEEIAR